MQRLLFLTITVILFSGQLFGQAIPDGCPEISVTGPAGVIAPGDPISFTASIKGTVSKDIKYTWTVSSGNIIEGQGTQRILVELREDSTGLTITATVEVEGLPAFCPNAASDSAMYCVPTEPVLISEFSAELNFIDSERFLLAAGEQKNYPTNQLYIIEYFPAGTSRADIDEKIRRNGELLVNEGGMDKASITFVTQILEGHEYLTKIYRIPPGAENPQP
ncbi:MAG: hypothetical protein KF685_01350 [Acidobacteria bacterium]|nr:hypothetical protein [Acidobacteriota bacterium]